MGYLYLLMVAFLFSFGGTYVKLISPYFSSECITFFRFVVGVGFLLLLKVVKNRGFSRISFGPAKKQVCFWILAGALGKWFSYLSENYALSHGSSYGNIVAQPVQTVFITAIGVLVFHDKMTPRKLFCIFLCICGVLSISLNGRPLTVFYQDGLFLTMLFVLTGIFGSIHVLSQKMIADKMNIIDSNLSIFFIASLFSSLPVLPAVADGSLLGVRPDLACIFAIIMFGFNTGIGFYINAKAIPLVPFYMVSVIQSMMAIFAILWGVLFFHETITIYIIGGTLCFLIGLIGLQ